MARLIALCGALIVLFAGCDWATYRYGPSHTGFNPFETKLGVDDLPNLGLAWSASTPAATASTTAVSGGVAYVGSDDGHLYAFDADASTCAGVIPKSCEPLWTGAIGGDGPGGLDALSSPSIVGGVVYIGSLDGKLYAFDAKGTTGCSGVPKTCTPLWTATTGAAILSSPTIAGGVVYIGSNDAKLYAFDAKGTTGCSGSPKTCSPLWTATTYQPIVSSPTVGQGMVYVTEDRTLYAFDATGTTGCSGAPKTCAALWWAPNLPSITESSPAIANGVVYVQSFGDAVLAFDAHGGPQCFVQPLGGPKQCQPLWGTGLFGFGSTSASPAVANGVVYIGSTSGVYAFDANGVTGCAGVPKSCGPLWHGTNTGGSIVTSPVIANGVVYVVSDNGTLTAFDAAGQVACGGAQCFPLAELKAASPRSSPIVANGTVHVGVEAFSVVPGVANFLYDGSNGSNGTARTWTVPPGVSSVTLDAYGAQGGGVSGGLGGRTRATLAVSSGDAVTIRVGGQPLTPDAGGFNGGGTGTPSFTYAGGGASDVRSGTDALSSRVIVAGGGGGQGSRYHPSGPLFFAFAGGAGAGVGTAAGAGTGDCVSPTTQCGGGAASASAAGVGGPSGCGGSLAPLGAMPGGNGALGQGGNGGTVKCQPTLGAPVSAGASGGGGGAYGGGGGGASAAQLTGTGLIIAQGSGGGGSGFAAAGATSVFGAAGVRTGNGRVTISY